MKRHPKVILPRRMVENVNGRQLTELPWSNEPGSNGRFQVTYNSTEFLRENRLSCEILGDTDREMDLVV
jgi:hypothetical protein